MRNFLGIEVCKASSSGSDLQGYSVIDICAM